MKQPNGILRQVEHNIFGDPRDCVDTLACQRSQLPFVDRDAQAGFQDSNTSDGSAQQVRPQTAANGLDFG
jgi:hypothetical protein